MLDSADVFVVLNRSQSDAYSSVPALSGPLPGPVGGGEVRPSPHRNVLRRVRHSAVCSVTA